MGGQTQARGMRAVVWWLLFWSAAALPATAAASPALFPPQATVLLLSGLPGDVESETEYLDELRAWLELVEGESGVHSLFVLCDQPTAVAAPGKPETKVL